MIVILFLQLVIVVSLVVSSRRRLEDALPVFCFFLVLMPLESRLVIPGLFDFNTMRLSLLTLLILYIAKGRPTSSSEPLPLKGLMFLHIGWAICSALYSLSVLTSAKQVLSQVLEYYLMYYLLVKTISSVETIYKIVYAMMMAVGLCCVFSLFEAYASWSILSIFPSNLWITYDGRADPLYVEIGRGLRVRSTFPHPILFGDALAMSIPFTLYLLSVWEKGKKRSLLWLVLILMFWADYKTSSRGPWICTGIALTLLFFLVKTGVRKYLVSIALLVLVVLLARPGIWETMSSLYTTSTDPTSPVGSSYLFRHTISEAVKAAVLKDPARTLLGYGLGTFRELGLDIMFLGNYGRTHTCDDNWAAFLYETGYVGLILIGALLFKPMFLALRNYSTLPRPEKYLSAVLFICLGGFNFLMLSVAAYAWGQQGYMNWILISLVVSLPRVVRRREQSEELEDVERELESDEDNRQKEEEYGFHVVA